MERVLGIAGGVAAGALAMFVVMRAGGKRTSDDELRRMDQRVAALESPRRAEGPPPAASAAPRDMAAARAWHAAQTRELAARFDGERPDPAWSTSANGALSHDLKAAIAKGKFELLSVECRATMCIAKLRWPSYAAARDGYSAVLHADYEHPCARTIDLPQPEDSQAAYDAVAYFTCGDAGTT